MSGLKPKRDGQPETVNPGCLRTQDFPAVCLRLHAQRERIAIPYALLLRVALSEDETRCAITFATHEVTVQGSYLEPVYVAVSQGMAAEIAIGRSGKLGEGVYFSGPLVTQVRIDPTTEGDRARR